MTRAVSWGWIAVLVDVFKALELFGVGGPDVLFRCERHGAETLFDLGLVPLSAIYARFLKET